MNKVFSFLAGGLCGALVGSVTVLLLTPASGEQLRTDAVNRWEEALRSARQTMVEKRLQMEAEFEQMRRGG